MDGRPPELLPIGTVLRASAVPLVRVTEAGCLPMVYPIGSPWWAPTCSDSLWRAASVSGRLGRVPRDSPENSRTKEYDFSFGDMTIVNYLFRKYDGLYYNDLFEENDLVASNILTRNTDTN